MRAGATISTWPNNGRKGRVYDAIAKEGTTIYQQTPDGLPNVSFSASCMSICGPPIQWRFGGSGSAGVTMVAVVRMTDMRGRFERIFEFGELDAK